MKKNCAVSGKEFEISEKDLDFYKKMGLITDEDLSGLPTLCPDERLRRKLAWRNERNLYWRECDGTGKKILSMYDEDSEFPVYGHDYWWSDKHDGKDFGRNFDFSKTFFENFRDLQKVVPKISQNIALNENSEFVNVAGYCKDCFWVFEADNVEGCLHCNVIYYSNFCVDNSFIYSCELCYECLDCKNCYDSKFLQNCQNCSNSAFLKDCIGCKDCFGCVNLRNKQYYFLNKKCTKSEYETKLKNLNLEKYSNLKNMRTQAREFFEKFPHKFYTGTSNENISGDYIFNSKNLKESFDCWDCEDSSFISRMRKTKNSMDVFGFGLEGTELCYECNDVGINIMDVKFSNSIYGECTNIDYSESCMNSCKNLFGCIGLKKSEYCILNKKYSKEEFFILKAKIISHMKKTGEWGEFFPMELSPFGYNETVANEYFPFEEPNFLSPGLDNIQEFKPGLENSNLKYNWKIEKSKKYLGEEINIPDDIKEIKDDICEKILTCEISGQAYKIQKSELKFYRKMNLPIPRICPDERYKKRMALRNPRTLFERTCDNIKCDEKFETTFDLERKEKVFCEKCYADVVD